MPLIGALDRTNPSAPGLIICQIAYTVYHVITWDEPKRRENIRKHKIDVASLEPVFDHPMISVEDDRERYGELRLQSLGIWQVKGCLLGLDTARR